ncbi:O-antigen polysaccharide polymerase Wzy [Robertkochia solimangrovi]|uniref:O-antigen polysaccharide polymerase Wzy n=1 Tax=Robertkochia solimangrovi TaxID=2213046 RepID=UPI00117E6864|nr:O-antigen polysaccharide polymerase Wzy [Robertkochia solimangrovi]TRZ44996.1 hypothetical protein DMZ48_04335 [Robertkochia solimangrovi]
MNVWSIIGVILVIILFIQFFSRLGKELPLLEMMALIASLQWIIGPVISYSSDYQHYRYYMYVPEEEYMSFVVPGLSIFCLALLYKKPNITVNDKVFTLFSDKGKYILLVGILSDIASIFAPPSLLFFFFIVSQFKFVGAGILLFSTNKIDRYYFIGGIGYLVFRSLNQALFHELILWSAFMYLIWALRNKPSNRTIFLTIGIGIIGLIGLQSVKSAYRDAIKDNENSNKIALMFSLLSDEWSKSSYDDIEKEEEEQMVNVRLNQGWIISAIMDYTPEYEPYANGETITTAISASLLPRFLFPNKKEAGGQENFERFTGLPIDKGTSMGISIIGEAYANYGVIGGIIFMGFWGLFLLVIWKFLIKMFIKHPLILFFLPMLFLQVVKAETEFATVLNHLIKSCIVLLMFYWFATKALKWEI